MTTYVFNVSLEQDGDGWCAFYAPLEHIGASTWGDTQEEALQHIQEVLAMIVEEFAAEGPKPYSPQEKSRGCIGRTRTLLCRHELKPTVCPLAVTLCMALATWAM